MKATTRLWLFILLAAVAIGTHLFLFSYRYMWYVSNTDGAFLWAGYGVCLLAFVVLWARYPSRFLVATVCVVSFIFPPILGGDAFVPLTVGVAGLGVSGLVSLLLLVGATELRRRMRPT